MIHWTGILNLIAIGLATAVVAILWFGVGWHWYAAIPLWPVIYIGLPVLIGLAQGMVIRWDKNRMLKKLLRGEPLDSCLEEVVFGFGKRERAEKEIQDIQTWILGQSIGFATDVVASDVSGRAVFDGNGRQMAVALEACCFFLHAVSRFSYRPHNERLRVEIVDSSVRKMVYTFSEMLQKLSEELAKPTLERDIVDLYNTRECEYGAAKRLLTEKFNDRDSAVWLAAFQIADAAGIAHNNIRVLPIVTALTNSLVRMDLVRRIKRVETCL